MHSKFIEQYEKDANVGHDFKVDTSRSGQMKCPNPLIHDTRIIHVTDMQQFTTSQYNARVNNDQRCTLVSTASFHDILLLQHAVVWHQNAQHKTKATTWHLARTLSRFHSNRFSSCVTVISASRALHYRRCSAPKRIINNMN